MAVINIGLLELGAKVIEETSAVEDHGGENVLCEESDVLWTSEAGLPQSLVIDLRGVEVEYQNIVEIGFKCWHDYDTNPRRIELEVTRNPKQPYHYWQTFTLQKSSELQFFPIRHMHSSFRILKFTIEETYGDEETYLNHIYINAQTSSPPLHEDQLAVEDLHSPMKITFPKSKPSPRPYLPPEPSSEPELLPYETRGQYLADPDGEDSGLEQEEEGSPLKNDIYLLAQNLAQMEDNVQEIKRSVEVLDLKVQVASESIEKSLTKKLKGMVKQEMDKFKEEVRGELGLERGKLDLREVRSQKSRRSMRSKEGVEEGGSRQSSHRKQKQSLHLHNLNQDKASQSRRNEAYMSKLLNQLSKKLKEREVKVRKIQARQGREQRHPTHEQ